jgi:hypothetical protein
MVNYENSKIYKIVDNTNGNIYIGSTTEPTLARRLQKHKSHYNQYINGNRNFITSFNIIQNGDYDIILVEKCNNITSKDELHARERYFIENNNCVNKIIPGRSIQQYKLANKDKIVEYHKEYKKLHRDIISEKSKEYNNKNKETIATRKKEYYELNKQKYKEYYKNKKLQKELEKNKNI